MNPETSKARQLRRNGTHAERCLWRALRANQLCGHQFYQHRPIGPFVVDFCCRSRRLIVEVDGSIHQTQQDLTRFEPETCRTLRCCSSQLGQSPITVQNAMRKYMTLTLSVPQSQIAQPGARLNKHFCGDATLSLYRARNTYLLGSVSIALLGLVWVSGASAQQTGGGASDSSTASDHGQAGIVRLEEIRVTDSQGSVSITATSGADIQTRGGGDFNSMIRTQLTIRGVDGSAGSSPTIGFYLGQTPLIAPAGANDGKVVIDPALYDLDRVEVLRGPQTLYGATLTGGTVRLNPQMIP